MSFVPASRPLAEPGAHAWHFAFVQRELLVPEDAEGPTLRPLPDAFMAPLATARHYLGTLAAVDCWALALPEVPPGWRPMPLRAAMMAIDPALSALAGRAAQVIEWDRSHRHCGVCGTPTELHAGERSRVCPACGHTAYPRVSPAMMALIWRPGELLLARSPHYAKGMYSALAGFVEAGETLEECVHREVAEEVSVTVDDLRYYGSQSWPFPHSLMVAFTARWTGGEIVPQDGEIEDAQWFAIDALPGIPPRFSVAGHLVRDTVQAMRDGRWP
ncbi:MAG: NAD(+) diphosphatase [Rhizobacter sp.]|nr:NAD(+) diphosphatase [Rhizobacter sp.]